MRVVIDCNVFVTAVSSKSRFHKIITSLIAGDFKMHVSAEIYFEIVEKIEEKYDLEVSRAFLDALYNSPYVISSEPWYNWNIIKADPDDNKYIDCYIKANADYIVTNDKHFNILKQISFPKVNCITIEEFMEILKTLQ